MGFEVLKMGDQSTVLHPFDMNVEHWLEQVSWN